MDSKTAKDIQNEVRFKEIARRVVAGQTLKQIARDMDYSVTSISRWIRRPEFQGTLREMDEAIWKGFMETLESRKMDTLRTRAAKDMDVAYEELMGIISEGETGDGKTVSGATKLDAIKTLGRFAGIEKAATPTGNTRELPPAALAQLVKAMKEKD